MSTHRLIRLRQRRPDLSTFFALGGLLLALHLWLAWSVPALARPARPLQQDDQDSARAGVSVVRLVASYAIGKGPGSAQSTLKCTGLGALVASRVLPDASNQYTNWVLTDSSIVNVDRTPSCLPTSLVPDSLASTVSLSRIDITVNAAYTDNQKPVSFSEAILPKNPHQFIQCATDGCVGGVVLLHFTSTLQQPQPYLDPASHITNTDTYLALSDASHTLPPANLRSFSALGPDAANEAQLQSFLYPNQQASSASQNLEAGTPMVDATGKLSGMLLKMPGSSTLETIDHISTLTLWQDLTRSTGPDNKVHENWNNGMDAYYHIRPGDPHPLFQAAAAANSQFGAARHYAALTAPSAGGSDTSFFSQAGPFGIPIWGLAVLALVLLAALIVVLSILTNRTRSQHKRVLDEEWAEAERRATIEARRIAAMEARPPAAPERAPQTFGASNSAIVRSQPLSALRLQCPSCGELVSADANFCPNCRQVLSPSESGMHLRVSPQQAQQPAPARPAVTLTEQPTLMPASSLIEQPTLVPGNAVTEQPTVEMAGGSGSGINNKNSSGNAGGGFIDEPTVHYALQQLQGKHLGFVAGTRSDPGIKRKYRPNEDSLFAAQGLINNSTQPPVFGLFVVADGMGGHAQGEDASQLAIQTIINSVLPAVSKSNSPTREGYAQLLVEGIQQANQAVHQHNIEQHGDMGTTVTAALVVDTFAYVANVGDSRTYLYRPAEGLKKITTDHSVVASLVEAGIIKPDDIYTHPKRNQIYRSLGEKPAVEIDSFTVQLQEGDKLLLCSDGLWDMVRDPRIEELIKSPAPDPTATGDALIQEALASGGEDNVSVIVVHITEAARSAGLPRIQLLAKPDSVHMPQM